MLPGMTCSPPNFLTPSRWLFESRPLRVEPCPFEGDVGTQGYVTGHLLPHEVEGIIREPHVLSAADDPVAVLCGIEHSGTPALRSAHVRRTGKLTEVRPGQARRENQIAEPDEGKARGRRHSADAT
jgi:hypothetical protein